MKRKLCGSMFVVFGLVCLTGADMIMWDPESPVPNPGGAKLTIAGKGPYAVDPANTFVTADFFYGVAGQQKANTNMGKWDKTVTVAVPGNYDCWAELTTINANKTVFVTKTPVVKALPVQ